MCVYHLWPVIKMFPPTDMLVGYIDSRLPSKVAQNNESIVMFLFIAELYQLVQCVFKKVRANLGLETLTSHLLTIKDEVMCKGNNISGRSMSVGKTGIKHGQIDVRIT